MNTNPIGILDSGLGGLTIMQSVMRELPNESIIYVGDSANIPYGEKSSEQILQLSRRLVDCLISHHVKLIVVACNAITVTNLENLRTLYPTIPLIGVVPVIKTAAEKTKNGRIGVLATTATTRSAYQKKLIADFADGHAVFTHGTDRLVPLIEQGIVDGAELSSILHSSLSAFSKEDIDTLVLGCTHFPIIEAAIQNVVGVDVQILDSGGAVARQVRRVLTANKQLSTGTAQYHVYTTGDKNVAKKIIASTIEKSEAVSVSEISL